eukprot:g5373.t1
MLIASRTQWANRLRRPPPWHSGPGPYLAAALLLALPLASASCASSGITIAGRVYGDARTGAGGFAELVGAACAGACYASASAWSSVALAAGDRAQTPATCAALCTSTRGCDVYNYDGPPSVPSGRCELLRRTAAAPATSAALAPALMGACDSEMSLLHFPEDLPALPATDAAAQLECFAHDGSVAFGEGACSAGAPLLAVYATRAMLTQAAASKWWPATPRGALHEVAAPVTAATTCRDWCRDAVPGCAAFVLSRGTCRLLGQAPGGAGCKPALGRRAAALRGDGTVSGFPRRCVAREDAPAVPPELRSWFDELHPVCTVADTDGGFVGDSGTFRPRSGCVYRRYDPPATFDALRGSWVLINGGSNMYITALNLINTITPGLVGPSSTGHRTGTCDVLDLVWNGNRELVYPAPSERPHGLCLTWAQLGRFATTGGLPNAVWGADVRGILDRRLGDASAAYNNRSVRVTMVVGQYWENTRQFVRAVRSGTRIAASQWGRHGRVLLYANVMQWYLVCGVYQVGFCNRQDIKNDYRRDPSSMGRYFQDELKGLLDEISEYCGPGAPNRWRCFLAPNCYSGSQEYHINPMLNIMRSQIAAQKVPGAVQFLDFWALGKLKPQEIIDNHASGILMAVMWQIMLNVARPMPGTAARVHPEHMDFPRSCYTDSMVQQCTNCACDCARCARWECAGSRACTATRPSFLSGLPRAVAIAAPPTPGYVAPPPAPSPGGAHAIGSNTTDRPGHAPLPRCDTIDILGALERDTAQTHALYNSSAARGCDARKRVWCGASKDAWTLGSATFVCVLLVWIVDAQVQAHAQAHTASVAVSTAAVASPVTPPAGEGSSAVRPAPENLSALGAARLLASVHIVLGHLYQKGAITGPYLCGWGFTWVPWFFMLSGYVLTHARLNSRSGRGKTEPALLFLAKRLGGKDWYAFHRTGRYAEAMDALVVFFKFHPLCYLHVFAFGMCLAAARQRRKDAKAAMVSRGGAVVLAARYERVEVTMGSGRFGVRMVEATGGAVLIASVTAGGAGACAGMRAGDRVVELNGTALPLDFDEAVAAMRAAGRPLRLCVSRERRPQPVAHPADASTHFAGNVPVAQQCIEVVMGEGTFGVKMDEVVDADGTRGVMISSVTAGGAGDVQGVHAGDRVLELNGAPLPPTYDAAVAAIGAAARPLRLGLARSSGA